MVETWINDRWPLLLPKHRADRPEWPHWEAGRLASMWHHLAGKSRNECDGCGGMVASTGGFVNAQNGEVVYDIGSEEGDFPALFSSWGCDVVLFEPNDRVWPNIRAVWDANQLRPPLGMFVGFAGPDDDRCAHLAKGTPDVDGVWSGEWPEAAYGPVIGDHGFKTMPEYPEIPRFAIDDVARFLKPPTAITIDVEGAEYEVLLGAQKTLQEFKPKVWVSVHPEPAYLTYDRPFILKDIQALMADCGYPQDPTTGEFGTFIASDHEDHWVWLP
jgi:FkbM family methyltransferase